MSMNSTTGSMNAGGSGAAALLRERLRALGLSWWRCDNNGLILEEPDEPGALGLLLRSRTYSRLVSETTRRWAAVERAAACEIFEGCWLMPLEEFHRRRRTGFTVLVAFGPEALQAPMLQRACGEMQLDPAALRKTVGTRARYTEHSAATTQQTLNWMTDDLAALREGEMTSGMFTRQLTDSYETIDLLYTLGRSMNDLTHPDKFIARLCERVKFTLSFGWVVVWTADQQRSGHAPSPSRFFSAGDLPLDRHALVRGFRKGLTIVEGQATRAILTEIDGRALAGSGQILMQPIVRDGELVAVIAAGNKSGDDPQVSSYDIQLLEAAAGFIGAFLDNAALYADQEAMFLGTLVSLTSSIDAKDRYTCGHSQRVAHLAHELALAMGLTVEQADRVRITGLVHDVGKIGVPEAVLCKAGKLTDEEFAAIKMHPEIGHRILRDIPQMEDVLPGVLHHHERYDGRGYPHGLKGEDIPLSGRIIAIADTFDAMSSTRSYRSAMPRAKVLSELQRCAGTQLDPALVPLFVKLDLGTYDRMVAEHAAGSGIIEPERAAAA
jgi:HD-GYP domain-containing protein (c-di-GMP phosphodiesterase class II)